MTNPATVFVRLVDEMVDVWRPVNAEHVEDNHFRLTDPSYDPAVERWEFSPPDVVVCQLLEDEDGPILAAVRRA